ncbi:hypothetical protein NBRC110019_12280 [Neptunitalea chrysea]|uniref:Uncharacterized protein n=1 Tax=Neptunitalea chrysea TaxID=1647581 RepID=A0A9W6EU59_9FLAO|nr:hypothetical protein [Neptunitalea chrysea]GLB52189.1 hypothetical protein NBRC110019_12280 [Neptunitalea chrysea]
MKKVFTFVVLFMMFNGALAQVGIGTTNPQGILDIVSDDSTLVLPRNEDPDGADNVAGNFDDGIINPVEGMIVYDKTDKVVRFYDGTTWQILNVGGETPVKNEGTVKIESAAGGDPYLNINQNYEVNVYQPITYSGNLVFAGSPVTDWPENDTNPTQSSIYNSNLGTFIENGVLGQVHLWRVEVAYEKTGAGSNSETKLTFKMDNNSSVDSYVLEQSTFAFSNTGTVSFLMMTIANSESLPAPYGVGKGYSFFIKSSAKIKLTVKDVTRVSVHKD